MAKICSKYIDNKEYVWYNSSNILYSECDDNPQSLVKNVKIVFKKGRCYLYHDVSILDYVIFREHSSQGKALNEYIKKYECEKIGDINLTELENFKEKIFSEN